MTFPNPKYLTHPNIPKPLHGVNPRTILGREWWDEKRQIAYAEHNYHCWACGIHKQDAKHHRWLEAHESYDINYKTGEVRLIEIIALCHSCHNFIHSGRMKSLWEKKEMGTDKCLDILLHGLSILSKHDLKPYWVAEYLWYYINDVVDEYEIPKEAYKDDGDASWSDWHLNIDGKKYYTPYKNIDEWKEKYK